MQMDEALTRKEERPGARLWVGSALGWGFIKELVIVVLAYLFYFLARSAATERVREAMLRAIHVVDLEQRLGFFWELDMQAWALSHDVLTQFFNQIYIWGNLPFLGAVGVWFYLRHRRRYLLFRNAVLISGAIALVIFITLPTSPPRYLWWAGFKDTVALMAGGYYDVQADAFVNRYAAIPSMHFGWVLLLGIALVWTSRFLPARLVGVVMPLLMFLSIVVTGNHFIVDGLAGGAVALIGLALALLLHRHGPRLKQALLSLVLSRPTHTAS